MSAAMPFSNETGVKEWEEWATLVEEMGAIVRELKTAKSDFLKPALDELVHRKEQLKSTLLVAVHEKEKEGKASEVEALMALVPPDTKPSKKDRKAAKAEGTAEGDEEGAKKKAANIKAAEEQKLAARRKRKEEETKKKVAQKEDGPSPAPPKGGAPAAAAPAGCTAEAPAKAAAAPASVGTQAASAGGAKGGKDDGLKKSHELSFIKEVPPLLAITASRLAGIEATLKRVEKAQVPGKS